MDKWQILTIVAVIVGVVALGLILYDMNERDAFPSLGEEKATE